MSSIQSSIPSTSPAAPPILRQIAEFTRHRLGFVKRWVTRGMGIAKPKTLDPALLEHGLTLVLPGIESESIFTYGMCDGLYQGGVPGFIRVFNWGRPLPGGYLANLAGLNHNRRRAHDIAREILAYQDAYPGRPVHIVAQSGGAGMAVFAAEAMPEGRQLEGVVLLNAALSPTYNLAPALRRTRKGLLNSYSSKDYFVLHFGTRLFGTMDRQFTTAAGCIGFQTPATLTDEERELYTTRLHQLPWQRAIGEASAHWGGHLSSGSETFLAGHIAPWIRDA